MKNLLLVFSFLFLTLTSAWAQTPVGGIGGDGGGPKQSWQDIYKNPNLNPKFPTYFIQGRSISFNHLCLMGERVRTKYKYLVNKPTDLTKLIFDYLITDRVYEVEVCVQSVHGRCVQYENQTIEIPLKDTIKVMKKVEDSKPPGFIWEHAFEKDFELQECKDND